jgi:hypothetical protein
MIFTSTREVISLIFGGKVSTASRPIIGNPSGHLV